MLGICLFMNENPLNIQVHLTVFYIEIWCEMSINFILFNELNMPLRTVCCYFLISKEMAENINLCVWYMFANWLTHWGLTKMFAILQMYFLDTN